MGSVMGRQLGAMFGSVMQLEEPTLEDPKSGLTQEMHLDAIQKEFSDRLNRLGLRCISFGDYSAGKRSNSDRIVLSISSEEKFNRFLNSLSIDSIQKDPAIGSLLSKLADDTIAQIHSPISAGEHTAILNPATALPEALRSLNLLEGAEKLDPYITAFTRGYLEEFLAAKEQSLLDKTGFTPAKWIEDPAPEDFKNRWAQAVLLCEHLSGMFGAEQFTEHLTGVLLDATKTSKEFLAEKRGTEQSKAGDFWRHPRLDEILDSAEERLKVLQLLTF